MDGKKHKVMLLCLHEGTLEEWGETIKSGYSGDEGRAMHIGTEQKWDIAA